MQHVVLWAEDCESELTAELLDVLPGCVIERAPAAVLTLTEALGLHRERLPELAFARQFLPDAHPATAHSINAWAALIANAIKTQIPEGLPWALHIEPHYGKAAVHHIGARAWHSLNRGTKKPAAQPAQPGIQAHAGRRRCDLIHSAVIDLLKKIGRGILRTLRPKPASFTPEDTLVQVLLTSADAGWISVAPTPLPFKWSNVISPYPLGAVEIGPDKNAPSRAFAKLVEAEVRLGEAIQAGQTCVDLGAAPGSWTYVAVSRGARVVAVDRSALREDLMRNHLVKFVQHDAFRFEPQEPVDWLLCDVIAEPGRSAALLLKWLERKWCKRFVVTLKLKAGKAPAVLSKLREKEHEYAGCWRVKKLCANKKEISVYGTTLPEACTKVSKLATNSGVRQTGVV